MINSPVPGYDCLSKKSNVKMSKECPKLPNTWTMDEAHEKELDISRFRYMR